MDARMVNAVTALTAVVNAPCVLMEEVEDIAASAEDLLPKPVSAKN